MALSVLSLNDLLTQSSYSEETINDLLFSFETIPSGQAQGANDVESFLRTKAIQFEKLDLSRTYLVMSTYQDTSFIFGYFSISNRPLVINRKNFKSLSKSLQKALMGVGHKTDQKAYEIKGYLLGQLGKNFNDVARKAKIATGSDILTLAYTKILEAYEVVGGRILYLECEDNDKIKDFYRKNGFRELEDFKSPNNLCLFVKKIEHITEE
ncbi:MAG: GNAT family acetyltransferase [Balneolales bacterium]